VTEPATLTIDQVDLPQLDALAIGAAFLGTGGGGDPYLGGLLAASAIKRHGPVAVQPLHTLEDQAFAVPVAMMGTPSVMIEKFPGEDELDAAAAAIERRHGRGASHLMAAEMGGVNAMVPLIVAARRGLPVVDADGMGRAFPELQMVTFNVYGVPASPLALTNETGEQVLIEAEDSRQTEMLARSVIVALGGACAISCYAMSGAQARAASVPGTLSLAHAIGAAILDGRRQGDPFGALFQCLAHSPYYQHYADLIEARVADVDRRIQGGWTQGACRLEGYGADRGRTLELVFRNEFLIAREGGVTRVVVPDLLTVLDAQTAEPITTDGLKYGQRVRVVAASAAACMRTPAALAVFGPARFGFDEPFVALERRPDHVTRGVQA